DPIRSKFGNIEKDEINLEEKQLYIEMYVRTHKKFSFRALLEAQPTKMEIVVTFLVMLEMMKTGKIRIVQENLFDDIMITSLAA
ncbi:MAG: segregation/condensation protein A, partial [Lachnospiraceae bacterium]|nr:segregation/condensation protein A [Lachnospiraceae bacterium]